MQVAVDEAVEAAVAELTPLVGVRAACRATGAGVGSLARRLVARIGRVAAMPAMSRAVGGA